MSQNGGLETSKLVNLMVGSQAKKDTKQNDIAPFAQFAAGIVDSSKTAQRSCLDLHSYKEKKLYPLNRIQVHALIYETAHFWSDQVVSYISACTKLFGCKCMHQYTKHLYAKL